jgi:serine/threonine protein kinase
MELRVGKKYKLEHKLGAGSFGDIYEGTDETTNTKVAIKLERIKAKYPQLLWEAKVLQLLNRSRNHVPGIPALRWVGQEGDFNVMVMDLLGPNLEELFSYCGQRMSLKSICMVMEQMIHRVEWVHSRGLIHRDLKPENFCMGLGPLRGHHLYLIDFGLVKKYMDLQSGVHIPYKEGRALTGTARYASVNAHLGYELSRRDDMEALAFIAVFLYQGSLPWQGLRAATKAQRDARISEKKISSSHPDVLCKSLPIPFRTYLEICRSLKFEEQPPYQTMRKLWTDFLIGTGEQKDYVFDWTVKFQKQAGSTKH